MGLIESLAEFIKVDQYCIDTRDELCNVAPLPALERISWERTYAFGLEGEWLQWLSFFFGGGGCCWRFWLQLLWCVFHFHLLVWMWLLWYRHLKAISTPRKHNVEGKVAYILAPFVLKMSEITLDCCLCGRNENHNGCQKLGHWVMSGGYVMLAQDLEGTPD